jgi:hypothetical protein
MEKKMTRIFSTLMLMVAFAVHSYSQCVVDYLNNPPVERTSSTALYSFASFFPSNYDAAVNAAANIWTNADCGISIQNDQSSENSFSVRDLGYEEFGTFDLAISVLIYTVNNTAIAYTTTEINTNSNITWFTDPNSSNVPAASYDLETVVLHEFGHWFDLAENYSCYTSIMYLPVPIGTRKPLTPSDIYAVQSIYNSAVGVHDYIWISSFFPIISQNSTGYYQPHFNNSEDPPYNDYIVGNYSWRFLVQHGEGQYLAASGTTSAGLPTWQLNLGTLPYGIIG